MSESDKKKKFRINDIEIGFIRYKAMESNLYNKNFEKNVYFILWWSFCCTKKSLWCLLVSKKIKATQNS